MLNVKKLLTKMLGCLYIYGTDGYWRWKKYADGTFELWRTYSGSPATGSHYTTSNGFYAYRVEGFTIPAAVTPTSRNNYAVSVDWGIGSGFAIDCGTVGGASNSFTIYALATAGSQSSVTAHIYVTGKYN